ncbi:MAG: hypothetical protein HY246_07055 [Proteobacteria bacterium]|nr:hypothetical protein [Pseudomonadota bacterium]
MDYALMDRYAVPPGAERWFVERLELLPDGRYCYAPPAYAPPVAPSPMLRRGQITFGSFNNLAKVTREVVKLWADVLRTVPASRLLLKWRTLGDAGEQARLQGWFGEAGIDASRLELRGNSPHHEVLAQYADIDIALDPFPFSGGLTSCEALWMGVPVVTWPRTRPVSRQTLQFLDAIGLDQLVAESPERYVAIAVGLAADPEHLAMLRAELRPRLAASPLCDGPRFARNLETAYRRMWRAWCAERASGPARDEST